MPEKPNPFFADDMLHLNSPLKDMMLEQGQVPPSSTKASQQEVDFRLEFFRTLGELVLDLNTFGARLLELGFAGGYDAYTALYAALGSAAARAKIEALIARAPQGMNINLFVEDLPQLLTMPCNMPEHKEFIHRDDHASFLDRFLPVEIRYPVPGHPPFRSPYYHSPDREETP